MAGSLDLEVGEDAPPAGEPLRERERLWALAGLRERLGERDAERPRERDREREELSDRERLLDLKEGKKKYIYIYYTSFISIFIKNLIISFYLNEHFQFHEKRKLIC